MDSEKIEAFCEQLKIEMRRVEELEKSHAVSVQWRKDVEGSLGRLASAAGAMSAALSSLTEALAEVQGVVGGEEVPDDVPASEGVPDIVLELQVGPTPPAPKVEEEVDQTEEEEAKATDLPCSVAGEEAEAEEVDQVEEAEPKQPPAPKIPPKQAPTPQRGGTPTDAVQDALALMDRDYWTREDLYALLPHYRKNSIAPALGGLVRKGLVRKVNANSYTLLPEPTSSPLPAATAPVTDDTPEPEVIEAPEAVHALEEPEGLDPEDVIEELEKRPLRFEALRKKLSASKEDLLTALDALLEEGAIRKIAWGAYEVAPMSLAALAG